MMECLRITVVDDSQAIGNSSQRSTSPVLNPINQSTNVTSVWLNRETFGSSLLKSMVLSVGSAFKDEIMWSWRNYVLCSARRKNKLLGITLADNSQIAGNNSQCTSNPMLNPTNLSYQNIIWKIDCWNQWFCL